MPLIFVGGARGSGKSTLIKALKTNMPDIEHIILSKEVTRITPPEAFQDDYVGMRRLTPEQQYEAVSKVVRTAAHSIKEDPSKIVFIDGHYVSSSFVDDHQSFFPCLDDNAKRFEKLVLLKTEPGKIIRRRTVREQEVRPVDLTRREYLAECMEAKFLEKKYGTKLLVCRYDEFFAIVYTHFLLAYDFSEHVIEAKRQRMPKQLSKVRKQAERGRFPSQRKVNAVLRLLQGEELNAVSGELGVTGATLSEWQIKFIEAGAAALKNHHSDGRDEEMARLKALVSEMAVRNEVLREANRSLRAGLPLILKKMRSPNAPPPGSAASVRLPKKK